MNMVEACDLLQLESTASFDEIRSRFRTLASRFHPDRFFTPGERAVATRRFQDIAEAYAVLREFHRVIAGTVSTGPVEDMPKRAAYRYAAANNDDRISAWDLLEPLKRSWIYNVVELLVAPSSLLGAVARLPFILLGNVFAPFPKFANLIYSLSVHLLPGVLTVMMGMSLVRIHSLWAPLGGLWFILSGVTTVVLELVAQAIGVWQLAHRPVVVIALRDIDSH